jgi:hypothetical protein
MPKHNDLVGLVQGLNDFSTLVEQEAATAFVDIWTRRPPNKPQLAFWESKRHIKAISGANQCLRGDAAVLMWCGDEKRIDCIEVGDEVVAFDFTTGEFVPSQVKAIFTNPGRILHRFKHSQGWLECSQKHKVAVQYPSGRIALVRVMRAVKHQLPVWVDKEGHAELSELTYEGKIGYEPTWDINIDHHDHAFVCNNIVVSNSGKALPNNELVLTPSGYVEMGSIKQGDVVCTPSGGAERVTGVYPQGVREVWEITFNDGTVCRSDLDHLWKVKALNPRKAKRENGWVVKTLREIILPGGINPSNYFTYGVPKSFAEFSSEENLPMDAYALGLLIGDGGMTTRSVCFTSKDPELVEYLRENLPISKMTRHGDIGFYLTNGEYGRWMKNEVMEALKGMGLMGQNSKTTFVPEIYKYAPREDRIAIIQGLMDSDGTVDKGGQASFTSTSVRLANDVAWILRSLGERCTLTYKLKHCVHPDGHRTPCDSWDIYIGKSTLPLFRLQRKIDRLKAPTRGKPRLMVGFKEVDPAECTCITITGDEKLFMTRDFIPTHNSLAAAVNIAWDATGIYPEWYRGPRTVRGINAWVVGETTELTRDSAQKKLFGPNIDKPGWTDKPGDEALINSKYIIDKPTRKSVSGAIDMVRVKHVPSDTTSLIAFKSHGMETGALASWTGDRAWIDEECPLEILDEIQARMSTTNGYIYCSYCPQHGRTPFVKSMEEEGPDVFLVYMTYDDINHISEEVKARNIRRWSHDPAMLAARTQGHATSNSGLIFPFPTKDILYDPALISIGKRWKFLGGMDVGWTHPTAAVGLALDPMADVVYCYVDYEQDRRPPVYHYGELDGWGRSMTFMIDPASDQVAQKDGEKILEEYWTLAHGAGWENIDEDKRKFIKADNSFLTGMGNLWHRFSTNRLFISKNLKKLIDQYANYEWNKKGDGPMEETPSRKYDIITSLRYGVGGINQYSHILNDFPPWMTAESFEEPIEIKEWSKFRAGGSPPITDQFGHTY